MSAVLFWPLSSARGASQKPHSTTFEFKEAKTPAESVDAIKLLERALELTETAVGPNDRAVGELAYRLAQRYDDAGEYDKALRCYERSLAIKEKELGPEDPGVGDCLNDMGCVQQELENYDEALKLFKRSLTVTEKVFGPEHPEVAITLSCMAEVYCEKFEYAEALRVGERSLRIREKTLGKEHPDVADSMSTLAEIYRRMGKVGQALQMAEQSVAIAEKSLGPDDALVAECLFTLAEVQKDGSSFEQALALYRRALAINERISGRDHPDVFRNLGSLAEVLALRGDWQGSISTLVDLSSRQRRYLARNFQTSSWRVASRVGEVFRSSSEMLQTLCEETMNTNHALVADAAENSALSKAYWEEVQTAHAAFEAKKQVPLEELQSQYRTLQAKLAQLPSTEPDQIKRDATRLELETQLNNVISEMAQRVGLVAQGILDQNVRLSTIAQELPTGSALVDLVEYRRFEFAARTNSWKEQRYAAYLTFPQVDGSTNVIVERIDLGDAAPIDEAVELICKRLSKGEYEVPELKEVLRRVSKLVYEPLSKHLANTSHLIICPDGQLSRLPFEMLTLPPESPDARVGQFLIEQKTVSYVGSGREIVRLQTGAAELAGAHARSSGHEMCIVMGNPDFDLDLGKEGLPDASPSSAVVAASVRSLSRDYRGLNFQPLPGAEVEARRVAALLGGGTLLKLGREAREAALKAAVSPRVLHVATHGFFLSDQDFGQPKSRNSLLSRRLSLPRHLDEDLENPLLRCGIALAGANHALQMTNVVAEDGLLTGLEASLLNLQRTELVILSACESGAGEIRIGEGVMSLRRAFRIAGAETVLASNWQVSDKATDELMTAFVTRWRSGQARATAWREAQLSLLHSTQFSDPYFWAAFTLAGQWN